MNYEDFEMTNEHLRKPEQYIAPAALELVSITSTFLDNTKPNGTIKIEIQRERDAAQRE